MDGRESKITKAVLSNDKYRKILMDKIRKSVSIEGTEIVFNKVKYTITTGNLYNVDQDVLEFKEKMENEYCH